MSDLVPWLLEQIAEDERQCGPEDSHGLAFCDADEGAHYTDARVLAECEAKRAIVELHSFHDYDDESGHDHRDDYAFPHDVFSQPLLPCDTLKLLALPYADRPGYDESWRP